MATPSHEPPLVSVCMITYNHEPYIAQAIESVLMQQTDFPVELVIGEDCSTDNTRAIVCDYRERYPERIHLLLPEHNLGMFPNFVATLQACDGRYIALLEGDDYWTDPFKLQKQVDFLEVHPEYGLVHTDCDFLYVKNSVTLHAINKSDPLFIHVQEYDQNEIFDLLLVYKYRIVTPTVLFRRDLYFAIIDELSRTTSRFLMGDAPMWLEMSRLTKFHYIDDVTAVYRILPESASHSKGRSKRLRFKLSSAEMRVYYSTKYEKNIPECLRREYNKYLLLYKVCNPCYAEMYSLIQPSRAEVFFYNRLECILVGLFVQLWFWLQHKSSRVVETLRGIF
ncbi:MAG: glycosyltransferase [Caldisericales bacterium]|nr:glycosyltransferase [Caldisericales bacterium]